MYRHIVQSPQWAEIKRKYGNDSVEVGDVFYTKHKIPFLGSYFAYCPRVDPEKIDFEKLRISLKENNCVGLTFDVPNVISGTPEETKALEIFKQKDVKLSCRSEFATANFLLDIKPTEEELFNGMHSKHRYNARYALKKGVTIELAENDQDFDEFFKIFKITALRQNYHIRPKRYYQLIWEELHPKDMCHILIAKYQQEVLGAWMLFVHEKVLYYPYGGSTQDNKNLFASNALGWESIRFGKSKGCELFDMWGAADDLNDESDPYFGFTNFKAKFNGRHVKYMDSYDIIINRPLYLLFTRLNDIRWKLLEMGIIK